MEYHLSVKKFGSVRPHPIVRTIRSGFRFLRDEESSDETDDTLLKLFWIKDYIVEKVIIKE